ncbi:Nucleotide-binding, alpha-beta plait [Niveomyces insectorum RCEF 264]|uniref:Nucleolar protein 12 n=1 Tax=Niveomyces insectorum RCEF 264 TaxID=1081102 RepID=A0A167QS80_9HYPO|nr:Nucleotide-binding, alpha-beta plait [Niveomyces insectorum RCEF 264]
MGRKKSFFASARAVDPSLDALFASSVGPVTAPVKSKYNSLVASKPREASGSKPAKPLVEDDEDDDEPSDEEGAAGGRSEGRAEDDEAAAGSVSLKTGASKRKRKNRDDDENLESRYLEKLWRETAARPDEKRLKRDAAEDDEQAEDDADAPIVHESLLVNGGGDTSVAAADGAELDKKKADRTVFLSNVSIEAVTSRAAKKALVAHLESVLKDMPAKTAAPDSETTTTPPAPPATVESLRFRSVPFASASLPKRAAFITKAVLGATAQSTNAYAVYSTIAAARRAARLLNGTVVLGRHLRADSVAHPAPVDHRRCVFVGNLGFVDDETTTQHDETDETGQVVRKKRHKTPMDVEEGLWRVFGEQAGKVESVRVVRDAATRVGKGIAYVQFYDGTSVEAALLLADKKFPPLLPRPLRVSRCKAPHKTARALERAAERAQPKTTSSSSSMRPGNEGFARQAKKNNDRTTGYTPKLTGEQKTQAGRAAKLLGRSAATGANTTATAAAAPVVFEGTRARVGHNKVFGKKGGKGKDKGKGKSKPGAKPSNNQERRAKRAASWKAKQGGGGGAA